MEEEPKISIADELSPPDAGPAPLATIEKELTINFREPDEIQQPRRRNVSTDRSSSKEPRRRRRLHSTDRKDGVATPRRTRTPERRALEELGQSDVDALVISDSDKNTASIETTREESTPSNPETEVEPEKPSEPPKPSFVKSVFELLWDMKKLWPEFKREYSNEWQELMIDRNRCICAFIILLLFCGFGGFMFRFFESAFEQFYKCGVKRVKRDFIEGLWVKSQELRPDEWKSLARRKLMEFEDQLQEAYDAGVNTYSGKRSWSFLNSVVYCITVVTTIGYGHIAPSTNTGRAVTIVYAIFGIPLFLILLADFGKMFTRAMKFLWAFVRRLYYTGSCRKVRHTGPVQEVMKGVQMVYDIARFQRSPGSNPPGRRDHDEEEIVGTEAAKSIQAQQEATLLQGAQEPPTPAPSNFCVDDEFNLPISVAIAILVGYIFVGATLYCMWEEWSFFEAFYFVFISMSTIGFGDYVPKSIQTDEAKENSNSPSMKSSSIFSMNGLQHPMFMMGSIVYLVFGLALTSMCINVVQVKLSDTFRQASSKIGASLGLRIAAAAAAEEEASRAAMKTNAVELADVHTTAKKASEENLDGLSLDEEEKR